MEFFKNTSNEYSREKNEKQKKWDASRREVNYIVDKLGLGIDEGIKDMVATLRAMDFATSSSCAGHTESKEERGTPYIEICTKAPVGWKEDKEKQELWRSQNLKQFERFRPLLVEYDTHRNIPADTRLIIWEQGIFGAFRLQSAGVKSKELRNLPEKPTLEEIFEKIKSYQAEMQEFERFLKNKFLRIEEKK